MSMFIDVQGGFEFDRPLSQAHAEFLVALSQTRRQRRDPAAAATLPDPKRIAAGLPIGEEGGFFVGAGGFMGQDSDLSVRDANRPPAGQPGLWCPWTPTADGRGLVWGGAEELPDGFDQWVAYLIDHLLAPWGYTVNGAAQYVVEFGECGGGTISVRNNKVELTEMDEGDLEAWDGPEE